MKFLIVVDMQNDFIDGSLGTKEAAGIVMKVKAKIEELKAEGYFVIFTRDTHDINYLETQEGKKLPVQHCIKGTYGWEISKKLDTAGSVVIDKPSFGSLKLINTIKGKDMHPEEIVLMGLCTDICVISNAIILKAAFYETRIVVLASCCAGTTPESHKTALKAMEACQIETVE